MRCVIPRLDIGGARFAWPPAIFLSSSLRPLTSISEAAISIEMPRRSHSTGVGNLGGVGPGIGPGWVGGSGRIGIGGNGWVPTPPLTWSTSSSWLVFFTSLMINLSRGYLPRLTTDLCCCEVFQKCSTCNEREPAAYS